jgi:3-oxoadipate enol-lactonase
MSTETADPSARFAEHGEVRLRYRSDGRGPAVLLVMGYGMTLERWWRTAAVLARRFRVLRFDNRGVGGSDLPALPYSVAAMADDAVAVLEAAGQEQAHVYGLSLGGMVAQEIALRHPERVQALVLGATTAGGAATVLGDPTTLSLFSRASVLTPDEAAWAAVPHLYAERTRLRHGDRIADDLAQRPEDEGSAVAHAQQLLAAATHSAAARLGGITAPTLVVHGVEDRVLPPENARRLAAAIPGAELSLWDDAGHLYTTDAPGADREVARFLRRHTPSAGREIARFLRRHTPTADREIARFPRRHKAGADRETARFLRRHIPSADREVARFLRRHTVGHGGIRDALVRFRDWLTGRS